MRAVEEEERCIGIVNTDAFGFALRMSIVLTTSTFFVLYHPTDPYPQGSWVFITCLVVSWFPSSMSAASVVKKTFERIVGTIIGSLLALAVGFVTSSVSDVSYQAMILGCSVFVVTFGVAFLNVSHSGVFGKHPYASLLVLLTFGIVVFPFYNASDEHVWMRGVFRILNIIIGCILSAVVAMVVFPKPTYRAIQESLAKQVTSAGEASREVLQTAVQVFSKQRPPIPLREKLFREHEDEVFKLTKQAMGDFHSAKALYPLLPYDAFYLSRATNPRERSLFESETQLSMYRAFRIHAIVLLINATIHNDMGHDFSPDHLALFDRASNLIPIVLRGSLDTAGASCSDVEDHRPLLNHDACALELCTILGELRKHALDAAEELARLRRAGIGNKASRNPSDYLTDLGGITIPPNPSATVFLLELVENLILRLLRLYATLRGTSSLDIADSILQANEEGMKVETNGFTTE